jgi:hypothetical protein
MDTITIIRNIFKERKREELGIMLIANAENKKMRLKTSMWKNLFKLKLF